MRRVIYRETFFAHNGPGPYACHFCGESVGFDEVQVHHLDEDPGNNWHENLAPAHGSCHTSHHHSGKVVLAPTRKRLSLARKSNWSDEQYRKRQSESHKAFYDKNPGARAKAGERARKRMMAMTPEERSEKARRASMARWGK